jgi:hypothetical protein
MPVAGLVRPIPITPVADSRCDRSRTCALRASESVELRLAPSRWRYHNRAMWRALVIGFLLFGCGGSVKDQEARASDASLLGTGGAATAQDAGRFGSGGLTYDAGLDASSATQCRGFEADAGGACQVMGRAFLSCTTGGLTYMHASDSLPPSDGWCVDLCAVDEYVASCGGPTPSACHPIIMPEATPYCCPCG